MTIGFIWFSSIAFAAPHPEARNIVLLVADDQRADAFLGFMPETERAIVDQGVLFSRTYVTTAACCPSRSTLLTGLYAGRHGVLTNEHSLRIPTVVNALHEAGYYTGLVGKYLNTWDGSPRGEFDYWSAFAYGSTRYTDPRMNVNGEWQERSGYITDILRDDALRFLDEVESGSRPFFLMFTPNAPHSPATPAGEDLDLYQGLPPYRPPSWGLGALAGKPAWLKRKLRPTRQRLLQNDVFRIKQLQTLASLDRAIGSIMEGLEARHLLQSTLVIYISDNGVFWGEFGLESKDAVYEPAIHVPCAVRLPGIGGVPRIDDGMTANIDIAPTIYDYAGVRPPYGLDGESLLPRIISGAGVANRSILIEGYRSTDSREPFQALHTGRFKYVRHARGDDELYDLARDPYEVSNLSLNAARDPLRDELRSDLAALLLSIGIAPITSFEPPPEGRGNQSTIEDGAEFDDLGISDETGAVIEEIERVRPAPAAAPTAPEDPFQVRAGVGPPIMTPTIAPTPSPFSTATTETPGPDELLEETPAAERSETAAPSPVADDTPSITPTPGVSVTASAAPSATTSVEKSFSKVPSRPVPTRKALSTTEAIEPTDAGSSTDPGFFYRIWRFLTDAVGRLI